MAKDYKAEALAKYLGVPIDAVEKSMFEGVFDVDKEGSWMVFDDKSQAIKEAERVVKENFYEDGLDMFDDDFKELILKEYLRDDFLENYLRSYAFEENYYNEGMSRDEIDEETDEFIKEHYYDLNEAVYELDDSLEEVVDEDPSTAVDIDAAAKVAVRRDGVAHIISMDNEEHELDNDLLAYRVN